MKTNLLLLNIILLTCLSCKKDNATLISNGNNAICTVGYYDAHTNNQYFKQYREFVCANVFGCEAFYNVKYMYTQPCFNPVNSNQIIFMLTSSDPSVPSGLYKFNFCIGIKELITTDIKLDFDWGSNGWIVFTANDNQLYKIKSNRDSLTKLTTNSGANQKPKWSPDGTKLYFVNNSTKLMDKNGNNVQVIQPTIFDPIDWIDNQNILVEKNGYLYSFNITNLTLSAPMIPRSIYLTSRVAYDRNNNHFYISVNNGSGAKDYYIKFNLNNNTVDTVRTLYASYFYAKGSFSQITNKIIMQLNRRDWKDSIMFIQNCYSDLIIMNPDGTDDRMLNLN